MTTHNRSVSDALDLGERGGLVWKVADTLAFVDAAGLVWKAADALSITDVLTGDSSHILAESLAITESILRLVAYGRAVTDALVVTDSFTMVQTSGGVVTFAVGSEVVAANPSEDQSCRTR